MPLLKEIAKNSDKESHKTTGSVQAYTDTATRDKEESLYYQFAAAKKTKGISDSDFKYIEKATGSEAAAQRAVIGAPVSILRQMIDAQKAKEQQPTKQDLGSRKDTDKHQPPMAPTVPSAPKPPIKIPEGKEDTGYRFDLDTTKNSTVSNSTNIDSAFTTNSELNILEMRKRQKGISDKDYKYLVLALGSETLADRAILVNNVVKLRKTIDNQKAKQEISNNNRNTPNIFQGSYGDKYFADDKNYYSKSPITEDGDLIYKNSISKIEYYIEDDLTGEDEGIYIGNNGCAIVSTVMALETFDAFDDGGTYQEHVKEAAGYSLDGGYKSDSGTDISKFTVDYAQSKGLDAYYTDDFDEVTKALYNGGIVVASVTKGNDNLFTRGNGHIITITDMNSNGTFHVNNPNKIGYDAFIAGEDDFSAQELISHNNNGYVIIQQP